MENNSTNNNDKNNDKRELLKLKQGLVSAEESPLQVDEKPEKVKLKGRAAFSNFVYHHSLHLKIGGFFAVIALVFAFFILTADKPDITVLLIADTTETSMFFVNRFGDVKGAVEEFTPDFNGDGTVIADCRFIDLVTHVGDIERNPDAVHGNNVKLIGEITAGNALIYIGNKQALENIPGEVMSSEDFYRYFRGVAETKLGSQLLGLLETETLPDDLYIAFRNAEKSKEFPKALTLWENITG